VTFPLVNPPARGLAIPGVADKAKPLIAAAASKYGIFRICELLCSFGLSLALHLQRYKLT
jgi:hypothetical protein